MHAIAAMKECLPKSRPKSAGTEAGPEMPVPHPGVLGRDILLHSHSGSRAHTRCELQASALMHTGRQMQSLTSTSLVCVVWTVTGVSLQEQSTCRHHLMAGAEPSALLL